MRVTYIHQHFRLPSEAGGIRSWEFARRLVNDGHTVTLIAGHKCAQRFEVEGVRVHRIGTNYDNSMSFARRLVAFADFMLRATIVAARVPCDVIFATSTPLTVALPARVASLVQSKPYVFEVRDVWPALPIRLGLLRNKLLIRLAEIMERWAYTGAAHIVALSPGMAADIARVTPGVKITVIPNGSDSNLFDLVEETKTRLRSRLGWKDQMTVIYAGSLGQTYDPLWLAHLACQLHGRGVRLVVAGDGAALDACRRLVEKAGLEADSVFLGALPKRLVVDMIIASDACISSLRDEPALEVNSLNKVFDAFGAGRPVFLNHGGWLSEICVSHGAGWRVDRNANSAARDIHAILNDANALELASRASRRLGRTTYSRDVQYQDFVSVLRAVATAASSGYVQTRNSD